jgi:ubiquinone/menaquinone biosynthesis C-methylase UbiE
MIQPPPENAQAFWEAFAAGRQSCDDAATAGLALYGTCPLYDAYRHRAECIAVGSLLPSPSPNWRVLDVGCGPGRWTVPFAKSCAEVVAVDFSENMLAHARKRCEEAGVANKVSFKQQRLEDLDADALGKPFDLVLVMGVLQFVPQAELPAAAQRLARCVAPGGLLLHRETRSPRPWEKKYSETGGVTMKSYYKRFADYRDAFAPEGLSVRGRRSIIPPSILYSIYSRFVAPGKDPLGGWPLKALLSLHKQRIDPLWRSFPDFLWWFNSRRLTDQAAVLYGKA